MVSNPACGTKVAVLKQFLAANQRPPGHRWKNLTEQTTLHARRATHTQDMLTVRVNPDGSLRLQGDVCHPGVDQSNVDLADRVNAILRELSPSLRVGQVKSPLTHETVMVALEVAVKFVKTGLDLALKNLSGLEGGLAQLLERIKSGDVDVSLDIVEEDGEFTCCFVNVFLRYLCVVV